mmetsp:Transcript_15383/g.39663  ORF Transcript_15383/g.39663 Transcript_15383/m.39663 type:complete len:589 (+) Transcript_15383:170-1936(+)
MHRQGSRGSGSIKKKKSTGGLCGPDLSANRAALLALPIMIGLTILITLHNVHIQHTHIHRIGDMAQNAKGGDAQALTARGVPQSPEKLFAQLVKMPQSDFSELMQRVYARRVFGLTSNPVLHKPAGRALGDGGTRADAAPTVPHRPRGSDPKILVLGVCTNIHNADSPMYVNYNKWALDLWQQAFPDKRVVLNHLGKTCFENSRSTRTQIKSEYTVAETDAIQVTWNNFDDSFRKEIREFRNAHMSEAKTGRDGLVVFNGAIPTPHTKSRPLVVADNTETWAQTDKDHDIIIEAISRHSNWGSVNVWWPVASRDFSSERYRLPSQTPKDLIVPADFKPPTDSELAKKQFCAFMFSKCEWYQYKMDAMVRTAFFDTLKEQYKPALALGGCRGDKAARRKYHVQAPGENYWIASTKTYEQFKFAVAFENKFVPGYWTEKMLNAVLAGAIPIYAGETPEFELAKEGLVNPKRYIYCYFNMTAARAPGEVLKYDEKKPDQRIESIKRTNPDDLKRCVDKVREIDEDNDKYRAMVSEPIIPGNKVEGSIYEIHTIAAALRRAVAMHKSYLVSDEEIAREEKIVASFAKTVTWP